MADTVVLMKNRVLDMAMRGELVDQRPEEGSAEELILSFKKENKLKEINKDEIPYTIPQSWLWVDFESIIKSIGTKNNQIKSKEIENTGTIPVVSQGKEYIDGFSNQVDKSISPKKPVILFGDHTRNVKYIDFEFIIGADGTKIFESLLADSKYLFRWVQRASTFIENRGYSRHYSLLKKKPVPIPPLAEQKRIVAKIEEIFAVIDQIGTKKEEALSIIRNMRQTALQDAIMGVLVEQDDTDEPASILYEKIQVEKEKLVKEKKIKKEKPLSEVETNEVPFDIPESWKWVKMGSLANKVHYGYTASATEDGNAKMLRITDIQGGRVNWNIVPYCEIEENKIEQYKLNDNDIVIARTGGTVGKSFKINKDTTTDSVFASYLIRIVLSESDTAAYVAYFLNSPYYWEQIGINAQGTGQPNVNATQLSNLILPFPPLAEQERIVENLDEIMAICDQMEAILNGSSEMVPERIN